MGRCKNYRERIKFETLSVESKSIKNLLSSELRWDFCLSSIESDVLSLRSLLWLGDMDCGLLPGQLYLSVPSSATKKYAASRRRSVRLTVVDISRDGKIWREYEKDAKLAKQLQLVMNHLVPLTSKLSDTFALVGGEAYSTSRIFYHHTKNAANETGEWRDLVFLSTGRIFYSLIGFPYFKQGFLIIQ